MTIKEDFKSFGTEMRKSDGSALQTVTCSEKAVININTTTPMVSASYQWNS